METPQRSEKHDNINRCGGLLYVSSIAVIATVGAFLAVVAAEHRFRTAEAWVGAGVLWAFCVPSFLVLSALSWFVYLRYRRATSMAATTLIYVGNLLAVLLGGLGLTCSVLFLWGRLQ